MSLGVIIKGPEGLVLAADSRVTVFGQAQGPMGPVPLPVTFDNATKILNFQPTGPHVYVGAVTYGAAVIGLRSAHSFLPELDVELQKTYPERTTVANYASFISDFFLRAWKAVMPSEYHGPAMTFLIGGYDVDQPYGTVYLVDIPNGPTPQLRKPNDPGFGIDWGGQMEITNRIIKGFDPQLPEVIARGLGLSTEDQAKLMGVLSAFELKIPYPVLPLQDCVNLGAFLIETTMTAQALSLGIRGVGGMIEVAVIKRTQPLEFVKRKTLHSPRG